jgi:sulfite reductase (NADPH) hemoprotein beta-component
MSKNNEGQIGFRVLVGGGQGRTPRVAQQISAFLPKHHLLSYLEAILRVYNQAGRRDNIYKARIKILVEAMGIDAFRDAVESEWDMIRDSAIELPDVERDRILAHFAPVNLPAVTNSNYLDDIANRRQSDRAFDHWVTRNIKAHWHPDYCSATITLKAIDRPPGDASAHEMEAIADIAETFGMDEIRATYEQNLIIPHIAKQHIMAVFDRLATLGLAGGEAGLIGDMIACPGLDYCNLANARSLPLADKIFRRFDDADRRAVIGALRLNISGCINACGHHHAADIGILGVNKKGVEHYQITLGGRSGEAANIGSIMGPSFEEADVPDAIERIVDTYMHLRHDNETFADSLARLGKAPFKESLYAG